MRKGTLVIGLFVVAGVVWLGVYTRYRTTLDRSLEEWRMIESRAVVQEPASVKNVQFNVSDSDDMPDPFEEEAFILWTGTFNRIDPIHWAEWTVTVTQDMDRVYIEFDETFDVANGPDLYVLVSQTSTYAEDTSLNLWRIISNEWSQLYQLTQEEREEYWSNILVWCRAFNQVFSVAEVG